MEIIFAQEPLPTKTIKTIFLAGPTPREQATESWRPEALKLLKDLGFDGHVLVPEPKDGIFKNYEDQIGWETDALNMADIIVFWIPRNDTTMKALTTNIEWGLWVNSGKAILGYPKEATHMPYLQYMADNIKVPSFNSLKETLQKAIDMIGPGAERKDGECSIPLQVWNHTTFKGWYKSHTDIGNKLESGKVLWNFRVGKDKSVMFCFVVHANVWIKAEDRVKSNEFFIGRTDISSIALYYPGKDLLDTEILLVKEFRTPVRNNTGFVYELPGGSAKEDSGQTLKVALDELTEETSFSIDKSRVREICGLQLAGTVLSHISTLYAAEITKEERDQLVELEKSKKTFGIEADTEKTYVSVMSIRKMMVEKIVDFSTLGMIMFALLGDNNWYSDFV